MGHDTVKLALARAKSFRERVEAMERALELGMPLHEIEDYFDWAGMTPSEKPLVARQPKPRLPKSRLPKSRSTDLIIPPILVRSCRCKPGH